MDSTDEEFYGSTSFTTKGRRTKRQRITTTTATSPGGQNSYASSASVAPSPSTPPVGNETDVMSELTSTTEEAEELANYLILLSQGGVEKTKRRRPNKKVFQNNSTSAVIDNNNVYECKTCNRTFPSFQALGGHRTSHKKTVKQPPTTTKPPKFDDHHLKFIVHDDVTDVGNQESFKFSTQVNGNINSIIITEEQDQEAFSKPKTNRVRNLDTSRVHKCTICGSEFHSGQALGGHMRKHRPVTGPNVDVSSSTIVIDDFGGARNMFSLDLNLPATDHDEEVVVVVDDDSHKVEKTKFHVFPTPY